MTNQLIENKARSKKTSYLVFARAASFCQCSKKYYSNDLMAN